MTTQHAPAATCARSTRSTSSCAPTRARCAGSPGTAPPGRAGRPCPGAVDSGPGDRRRHGSRMWLFARRGGDVVYNVYDAGRGPENGWNGWKLLHPPPPPPPPPPACDLAAGRLTAHARLVRFGKRPRLAGRARRTDGAPLVSATIRRRPRAAAGPRTATADANGFYVAAAAARPDRAGSTSRRSRPARARCRAERAIVRTRAGRDAEDQPPRPARRHRALPRAPEGRPGARAAASSSSCRPSTAASGARSRSRARARTGATRRPTGCAARSARARSRFRARVRREGGYPYELGYSRKVRVRVR